MNYYGAEQAPSADEKTLLYRPTLTERLKGERAYTAKRLAELDAAIAALENNPQVQIVLDLVQRVAKY